MKKQNIYTSGKRILKKTKCLNSREEPKNKDKVKVIDELRHKYKLKVLLKVANIKKSTYEYYKSERHIKYQLAKEKADKEILMQLNLILNGLLMYQSLKYQQANYIYLLFLIRMMVQ